MELVKTANKCHFERKMLTDLALQMKVEFFDSTLLNSDRIIRFPFLWSWFSYRRLSKSDAKAIIRNMQQLGLVEIVPFHGIKLKVGNYGK